MDQPSEILGIHEFWTVIRKISLAIEAYACARMPGDVTNPLGHLQLDSDGFWCENHPNSMKIHRNPSQKPYRDSLVFSFIFRYPTLEITGTFPRSFIQICSTQPSFMDSIE